MGDGRWMAKLVASHLSGFESRHLLNSKWATCQGVANTLKPSKQKINLGFWRTGVDTWITDITPKSNVLTAASIFP
jgi:hypothetical protein